MPGIVRTKSGRTLSDADIERLAARAEKGIDLSAWKPRRGRPFLDAAAGERSPRIAVRVPKALHRRVAVRASKEGKSMSEVVRDLLEIYVSDPPILPTSRSRRSP
jgi:hypothetical protein